MNRKLLYFFMLCAIAGIAAYRLWGSDFDWRLFRSSLWSIKAGWLAASVVVTLITYVIRAFRWQVLLAHLKPVRIEPLIATTVIGFSAIYLLGRPGELARPLWLTRKQKIPFSASVATIIVERFLDSLMLIAVFAWALAVLKVPATAGSSLTALKDAARLIVAGSLIAIVCLIAFRSNIKRIVDAIPFRRVANLASEFSNGLSFIESGRSLALTLFHSAFLWIMIILQFWFMLLGMDFNFSAEASTLIMVGAALGSIAQIPGIGGGFQAGFVFCMATFFLVPAEKAIAASLIAWVFSYVPTVVTAAVYMLVQGETIGNLKNAILNPESQTV